MLLNDPNPNRSIRLVRISRKGVSLCTPRKTTTSPEVRAPK
jgi:hypothetical protein